MNRCSLPALALTLAASLSACSFDGATEGLGSTEADARVLPDAMNSSVDSAVAPPDAPWIDAAPCAFDIDELCDQGDPGGPLNLTATLHTDTDPLCRSFTPTGGIETCLVLVESVTQSAGVTTSVIGTRPLLLAATTKIELAGTFDISSRKSGQTGAGADDATCAATSDPENDSGGAAGAAGGSFAGVGGDGGNGDTDDSLGGDGSASGGIAGTAVAAPNAVRGGCSGGRGGHESDAGGDGKGGIGGSSGGGVHFVAGEDFALLGGAVIRATGAGAFGGEVQSGGGGGGSGGFVRIDATNLLLNGNISANGGSGGEGGTRVSGVDTKGQDGNDGLMSANSALGGFGSPGSGGDGGNGSSQALSSGGNGGSTIVGAGGGGGGAGFIILKGNRSGSGATSPIAITSP